MTSKLLLVFVVCVERSHYIYEFIFETLIWYEKSMKKSMEKRPWFDKPYILLCWHDDFRSDTWILPMNEKKILTFFFTSHFVDAWCDVCCPIRWNFLKSFWPKEDTRLLGNSYSGTEHRIIFRSTQVSFFKNRISKRNHLWVCFILRQIYHPRLQTANRYRHSSHLRLCRWE